MLVVLANYTDSAILEHIYLVRKLQCQLQLEPVMALSLEVLELEVY
jgi:hypothetical protein